VGTKPRNFSDNAFASTMIKTYQIELHELMLATSFFSRRGKEFLQFYSNAKNRIRSHVVMGLDPTRPELTFDPQ